MRSEIKRLEPNTNKHSHNTCDITANKFNQHFGDIGRKMNSKFQNLADDLFWEGSTSIHTFRFSKVSSTYIEKYLSS